jgi:Cd2+/Zn2+-exporting ATPase
VAFDKTGTVTEGSPSVSRVLGWGADERELLTMAAAAESRSEHPIARAIVDEAARLGIRPPEGVEMTALPGRGARARAGARTILLGSPRFFREEGLLGPHEERTIAEVSDREGSVVLVGWGPEGGDAPTLRGALVLTDRVRPQVAALLPELRSEGVRHIVLMSGDRAPAVAAAARAFPSPGAGFDEWRGDLLPDEKVVWIRELRDRHGPVLMVGDGVNDAPGLAASDLGMAMAGRGTALALDASDIALMEDDLSRIPEAFRIGRKASGIIRANIVFALLVKVAFVLLGGAGYATLWMAVVADMGSSLAVILNGLRALRA